MSAPDRTDRRSLNGWKEIAAYLGKSVRSVQRWEATLGLPVRRINTPDGHIVYAEIDVEREIELKQFHDIVGHYNRFDVFSLRLNRRQITPLSSEPLGPSAGEVLPAESAFKAALTDTEEPVVPR